VLALLVGTMAGSASALFLTLLARATEAREAHWWIIWLLPLAGALTGWLYARFGQESGRGSQLILEEIHAPAQKLPRGMAPLVLIATLLTHLFGGSAGREGTGVQMGAALADQLSAPFRLKAEERRLLLVMGLASGFGAVFGTPLAGAVFGVEILKRGHMRTSALFPALLASMAGHFVCLAWGTRHHVYEIGALPSLTPSSLGWALLAGVAFGLLARLFLGATHLATDWLRKRVPHPSLRPFLGGLAVAILAAIFQTHRYLGLGDPVIRASFVESTLAWWDPFAKILFTAITLGSGFKGGEVTPLFFVGSTAGHALSAWLPLPTATLAGLGFVSVFAGAANAPLASTLMAVELFGGNVAGLAAVSCLASSLLSGERSLYEGRQSRESTSLSELR